MIMMRVECSARLLWVDFVEFWPLVASFTHHPALLALKQVTKKHDRPFTGFIRRSPTDDGAVVPPKRKLGFLSWEVQFWKIGVSAV